MENEVYNRLFRAWFDAASKFSPLLSFGQDLTDPSRANWTKDFEGLVQKTLWFPPFSIAGGTNNQAVELYKEQVDLASSYVELYKRWAEVWMDFTKAWVDGTSNAVRKLEENKTNPVQSHDRKFYSTWIQALESRFDTLLRDPSFASKLGDLLSAFLDLKRKSDSLMERYYSLMNVPTRSEIDRIHRELYELKKSVRESPRTTGRASKVSKHGR